MKQTVSKSDQLFTKIFHASPFAMILFRVSDESYVEVNNAFLTLSGYSREEFLNHTFAELRLIVDPNTLKVGINEIEEFGSTHPHNIQIRQKLGTIRDVLGKMESLDFHGESLVLVMALDITEQKQTEKEFLFQNEEKEKRAAELVLANKELARRLQNIHALNKIDQAIVGSLDLNLTLHVVLEQTKSELNVDAAAVLLFNRYSKILEFAAGIGFRSKTIERSRLRLGEGLGGRAALEGRSISVTNLLNAKPRTQFVRTSLLADEGFVTYSSTPLVVKGQVKGILEVFHRSLFTPDQNWLDFLEVLAGQTAIAVDSANLFTDLQYSNAELFNAYDSTIEGWSRALDLRDKETEGHTQRVTELTLKLARAAGISEKELIHLRRGALLHDIGKMGVPDSILLKPDKLTDEEWVIMRKHPTFAFELITPIAYLRQALNIPYCHHEKWDGSGYPRGLKGEQIPLAVRLFSIVDVWDALRSDRPYRQGWSKERVMEHIKSLSGTHFEPKAVELFLNIVNEDDEGSL